MRYFNNYNKNTYRTNNDYYRKDYSSHYSGIGFSSLRRMSVFERKDLVKPYLHNIDAKAIKRLLDKRYENELSIVSNVFSKDTFNKVLHIYPKVGTKINELANKSGKQLLQTAAGEIKEIYTKLPEEICNDIFNVFKNPIYNLKFENRNENNIGRYKILDRCLDPSLCLITRDSYINSAFLLRTFYDYILLMLLVMKHEDEDNFEDFLKSLSKGNQSTEQGKSDKGGSGNGDGQESSDSSGDGPLDPEDLKPNDGNQQDGNNRDQDGKVKENQQNLSKKAQSEGSLTQEQIDAIKNDPNNLNHQPSQGSSKAGSGDTNISSASQQIMEVMKRFLSTPDSQTKSILDQKIDQAKEDIDSVKDLYSGEEIRDSWENLGKTYADDTTKKVLKEFDKNALDSIHNELKKISVNCNSLTEKIKNLLDKSLSFFSSREKTKYEPLLDSDSWDGLSDWELLHPKVRNIFLEDITIKDVKKIGKINIYIDISGSMGGSCGAVDSSGRYITRSTFAKAVAVKMKELNLLNDVYTFENSIHKQGSGRLKDILTISGSGGTDLTNVVRHIEQSGENAIIVTDGEDSIDLYSDKAFFVGTQGADFSNMDKKDYEKYSQKKQLVVFDGRDVVEFKTKKNW